MGNRHLQFLVLSFVAAFILSGCGGGGSDHNEDLAKDESFYEVGGIGKGC